jgi:hypothetical protein
MNKIEELKKQLEALESENEEREAIAQIEKKIQEQKKRKFRNSSIGKFLGEVIKK